MILAKNISDDETNEMLYEWIKTYHSTSDNNLRDIAKARIVKKMIPIVHKIAHTIARRSYDPIEDMVQAGFIGLLKAIERFIPEKNDNFRIYAGYYIIGEMRHYLRDKINAVKVPRYIQELAIRINNFTKDLTKEELVFLTKEEIATAVNSTPESVDLAMQVDRRKSTLYLEDLFDNAESLGYEEIISNDYEEQINYADAKIIFNDIINKLPPDERVIIDMYYIQDMNRKQIANALMLSPMSVTRRMKQAFNTISSLILDDAEKREILKGNLNLEYDEEDL